MNIKNNFHLQIYYKLFFGVPGDEERATRRVSYLKATLGDRMLESDVSDSDESPKAQALRR